MTFAEISPILAQAGGGGGGGGGGEEAVGIFGGLLCMAGYFALIIGGIVAGIMFLLTLYRALNECSPRNRTMEPGHVWLSFIPLAGIVFYFMAIFKVPDSLSNEYRDRGIRGGGDFGKNAALWFVLGNFLCPPVGLVFWIIYWRQVAACVKELQGRGSRDDDDYDDRPSKRRPRDDDGDDYEDDR